MAAEYGHHPNSLTGCANNFPGFRDPYADSDGVGVTASGTGELNPSPPNLEPDRPFEYQYSADPLSSLLDTTPVLPSCGLPRLGERFFSFPQASGISSNLAFDRPSVGPLPGLDLFVPPRDPRSVGASNASPSVPTNIHDFHCAAFGPINSGYVSQMPVNSGISQTTGDEFSNFRFAGEASVGASVGAVAGASFGTCPFAPPRFNEQHNNQNNHLDTNPTPPQPTRFSGNSNSFLHSDSSPSTLPRPSLQLSSAPHVLDGSREPTSDDYFSALLNGDFSSPSLPPLSSSPARPANSTATQRSQASLHDSTAPPLFAYADMPSRGESGVLATAASHRSRRGSTASMVDLTSPKAAREGISPSGIDPAIPMAPPPTRKRRRTNTSNASTQANARRPSSSAKSRPVKPLPTKRKATKEEDDLFDDSSSIIGADDDDLDVLDLTGTDEVPAELLKPKPDNRIKISKFQCSICMDNVSGLTVTHCGHMFCSECLHSALHIDHMKRTCPICRQKVELKARPGQKQAKNTFFHMELKLMTANRKGKRPVGQ